MEKTIDLNENELYQNNPELLNILLLDRSSKKNIIWGTNNYYRHGLGYSEKDYILPELLIKKSGRVIKPRIEKSQNEQKKRSKDMAEVFTPSWICNQQNNLIDNAWFGYENAFNEEIDKGWTSKEKVLFMNKNWKDYVDLERMEITCGEAPYLTSRYDVVNGKVIEPHDRIGLLDRKLKVISENVDTKEEWLKYAKIAFKRIYGYDYQGDNVLLARENLLLTLLDFYEEKFHEPLEQKYILEIAEILSWNIFQMDGLKYVIPLSCHEEEKLQLSLFIEFEEKPEFCLGCRNGDNLKHNGIYCKIKDWRANKTIRFIDLISR